MALHVSVSCMVHLRYFLYPSISPSLPLSLPLPSISGTGQYLLTGTEDGSVELHRLSDPYSLAGLKVEGHDVWTGYT